MATYPIKNKVTGEEKEVVMSVHEWDEWKEQNPDWYRYFTPETCPGSGEVGEWQDRLYAKKPGWEQIMKGVKKAAPTNKSITEKY
jgi:hypothetical protein